MTEFTSTLQIRRNSDGMVVTHPRKWPCDGKDDYLWSEGNFACDCNRADFFAQAAGIPENDQEPCGDDRFSVRLMDDSAELLYWDDDWAP